MALNTIYARFMSKIDQIHVEARSNTPKGCNAMYVEDVEDINGSHKRFLSDFA